MADSIETEIRQIVAEVLEMDPGEIKAEGSLAQMTLVDSVALLEILVALERRFQINITEEDLQSVTQVRQIIDLVRKKTEALG